MFKNLFPKNDSFYDLFDSAAANVVLGAELLLETLTAGDPDGSLVKRIEETEHAGDNVVHETISRLHKTFVTPLDREVIHSLVSRLDDVLDHTDAAAQRLGLFDLTTGPAPEHAQRVGTLLVAATRQIHTDIGLLRTLKDPEAILKGCVETNRLENAADEAFRMGLKALFTEEEDVRRIIMWKEVYESLENAIDRCEDVANLLEGVVLENA
jgi:uncharacterized protein Yka (UPF0111/DUF47 family)